MIRKSLLDLNVLIALTDPQHLHHQKAWNWFTSSGRENWAICPLTEMGFLRVTTNPVFRPGPRTMQHAIAILHTLKGYPGYCYWGIDKSDSWVTLTARFAARILGHQQVTDAYLLGIAIKENAVLVTFDRGIKYMAGTEFSRNVLILE
jgi:toxin-antitoxin system PIN domain toxin